MERPLVSFCLLCYNQREWIAAALEGAFAQTYRPLEIVISDDGSTDGSAEFIQEYISAHAPTDVTVVFNRNSPNLGILGNWIKMASLSHGELLIKADGDDISLPERSEKIATAWVANGKRATVVSHAGYRIGPNGKPFGTFPTPCMLAPLGTAMAWRRDCFTNFPPDILHPSCVEEVILVKRTLMLGGSELVLPDRLLKYRLGTGRTSTLRHHRAPAIHGWQMWLPSLDQAEHDLAAIADRLPPERVEDFRRTFAAERAYAENHLTLLKSPSFRERWKAFMHERRTARFGAAAPFTYAYLLPRRIGDWVLDGITRINQLRRRLRWALFKR